MVVSTWPKNPLLKVLAFVWMAPLGLLGSLLALALWPWSVQEITAGAQDVIVMDCALTRWFSRRHWAAFTFGWSVFYWGLDHYTDRIRNHERRHVWQQMILGVFWVPVYGGALAVRGYHQHPLERDAETYAAEMLVRSIPHATA